MLSSRLIWKVMTGYVLCFFKYFYTCTVSHTCQCLCMLMVAYLYACRPMFVFVCTVAVTELTPYRVTLNYIVWKPMRLYPLCHKWLPSSLWTLNPSASRQERDFMFILSGHVQHSQVPRINLFDSEINNYSETVKCSCLNTTQQTWCAECIDLV